MAFKGIFVCIVFIIVTYSTTFNLIFSYQHLWD